MIPRVQLAAGLTAIVLIPCGLAGQTFALASNKGLQPYKVTIETVTYQGRNAVRVMPLAAEDAAWVAAGMVGEGGGIAVLPDTGFHTGTIEVELAGKPRAASPADSWA